MADHEAEPSEINAGEPAECDVCGWEGDVQYTDGPDPDEQLERKEAREHTAQWVGSFDDGDE